MAASLTGRLVRVGLCLTFSVATVAACSRPEAPEQKVMQLVEAQAPKSAEAPPAPPIVKAASAGEQPFVLKSVLEPDAPIAAGDYAWNDDGAPDGPLLIAVDIGAQRVYVYRGGVEIGRSSMLYGADDKPTPLGTFPIIQKKRDHISNLYGAPMPYMLRLTNDGIALHGSEVEDGAATHGCIGLPDDFAALLFEQAKLGDKVIIVEEWMRDIYYGGETAETTI